MIKFRFVSTLVALVVSVFYSSITLADWSLNQCKSQVNFISIKNVHKAESHHFDSFSGTLDNAGNLQISIDLASVNTAIPIRDQRMQTMLFDTSRFSTATFAAQIDSTLLKMPMGTSIIVDIKGELAISGQSVDTTFTVLLTAMPNKKLQATTVIPAVINAADFGLESAIEAL